MPISSPYRGFLCYGEGNLPTFMVDNRKIAYFSAVFGHKQSDGNGNINLEGQKTEMFNIIVADIGNHKSEKPPPHKEV